MLIGRRLAQEMIEQSREFGVEVGGVMLKNNAMQGVGERVCVPIGEHDVGGGNRDIPRWSRIVRILNKVVSDSACHDDLQS